MTRHAAEPSTLEARLSAFVDGHLAEADRHEIDALLVNDADVRASLEMLRRGTDIGRRLFDDTLKDPMPLDLVREIKNTPLPRRAVRLPQPDRPAINFTPSRTQALAACIVFLLVGGGIGYMVGTSSSTLGQTIQIDDGQRDWLDDVVSYYRLSIRQRDHVAEIGADKPADILEWLTTGTGVSFRIPDLSASGLKFLGARMFTASGHPFGLLLYRRGDDGDVIGLTVGKSRPETRNPVEDIRADTALVSWSTPLATYVIVGPSSAADLDEIAAKAAGLI